MKYFKTDQTKLKEIYYLNSDKKAEKQESPTERDATLTLDDIRRTNESLNIMDMAPPKKHTAWTDFDGPLNLSTNSINSRNRSRNSEATGPEPHINWDPSKKGLLFKRKHVTL
jgi:hypothetical protein